jgi:hypothetical protein
VNLRRRRRSAATLNSDPVITDDFRRLTGGESLIEVGFGHLIEVVGAHGLNDPPSS